MLKVILVIISLIVVCHSAVVKRQFMTTQTLQNTFNPNANSNNFNNYAYNQQQQQQQQQGLDAIIFTFALPKLMGQLSANDIISLNQTISGLQGASGNQITPSITRWMATLSPNSRQQVQTWLNEQMMATTTAQQRGNSLINQNNISSNVRNAWQQLQRLVLSMTVTSTQFQQQLAQLYGSLNTVDRSQFDQIFQQVYGYNFQQYFYPQINTQAIQQLYQQNMGNRFGSPTSNVNSNSNMYGGQQMTTNTLSYGQPNSNNGFNSNTNQQYPMQSQQGMNPYQNDGYTNMNYGTQYSATGYAAPYNFNSAYGRRSAYNRPPMAPMMATP